MFKLEIETDNAAFEDDVGTEIAAIIEDLARKFRNGSYRAGAGALRDSNGNRVGKWEYTP